MERRTIITLGRQIGAGGRDVAEALSKKLGITLYDSELIDLAAKRSGYDPSLFEKMDEKKNSSLIASFFGRPSPTGESTRMNNFINNETLFQIQSKVISDIAAQGSAIFIGRCADYILRDDPDMVSVFITMPLDMRIKRCCKRYDVTENVAARYIEQNERRRISYYNYFTFKRWGDSSSYDICINAGLYGPDGTADAIIDLIRRKQEK